MKISADLGLYLFGIFLQFYSIYLITEVFEEELYAQILLFLTAASMISILGRFGMQPNLLKFRDYKPSFFKKLISYHVNVMIIVSFFFSALYSYAKDITLVEFLALFIFSSLLGFYALISMRYRLEDKVSMSLFFSKTIDKIILIAVVLVVYISSHALFFLFYLIVLAPIFLYFIIFSQKNFGFLGTFPSRNLLLQSISALGINAVLIFFKNMDLFVFDVEEIQYAYYIAASKYSEIFYIAIPFINIYFMKILTSYDSNKVSFKEINKAIIMFYVFSFSSALLISAILFFIDLSFFISNYLEIKNYLQLFLLSKLALIFLSPINLLLLRKSTILNYSLILLTGFIIYLFILLFVGTFLNAQIFLALIYFCIFIIGSLIYVNQHKKNST